jgi:DNA modification methylase
VIHHGDVRDVLPTLDAKSVQCVITSPPYWGLRDYGVDGQIGLEPTPDAYVQTLVAVFREVRRVLRDDGTVWLNLGDSYSGSGKGQMGSGSASDRRGAKQGTSVGTLSGGLPTNYSNLKPKDLIGIPWRVAFALQADGWYLRSDIIWAKGVSFCDSYAGTVMPESVTDRPTRAHEYLFLLTKSPRYYYDADAVRERGTEPAGTYAAVKGPATHARSLASGAPAHGNEVEGVGWTYSGTRNLRSVWTINPQPYREAHFATFPTALVEPCIKAGSTKSDLVLDPFAGSGTVGCVARKLAREFVGIELNPEYCTMARESIEGPLFARSGGA